MLAEPRDLLVHLGRSIFERGLTFGTSGNLSVRHGEGWLVTPTNVSLGRLEPSRLAIVDAAGNHVAGDRPTKEWFLHKAIYDKRPDAAGIVHLHSTYAVAVSCLTDLDDEDVLPPLTAYYMMRVGRLPLVPYYPPGDRSLAAAVEALAVNHHALLLANHGPVVAGRSLESAVNSLEELEETAKLFLLLRGLPVRQLSADQVAELRTRVQS